MEYNNKHWIPKLVVICWLSCSTEENIKKKKIKGVNKMKVKQK